MAVFSAVLLASVSVVEVVPPVVPSVCVVSEVLSVCCVCVVSDEDCVVPVCAKTGTAN